MTTDDQDVEIFASYHEGARHYQDRFDSRRLADRLDEFTRDVFLPSDREFIESRDMFFLATTDTEGHAQCSYKGGDPGFVRVVGDSTLAFPLYNGNGMFLSLGNVSVNPHVGMLFIDFYSKTPWRLRVNGVASVDDHDPLVAEYPKAMFVVRVRATHIFPNCPRYIHRMELVERSRFVPRGDVEPPIPDWKREEWACDVLPADDPARTTP